MPEHVHLCVRIHRDKYEQMWERATVATREAIRADRPQLTGHRIWAERPFAVYLTSPEDIRRTIGYVEGNPAKHGLPAQTWDFVVLYGDRVG
ncbi:MAG TPA: hypothetical protein VEA69_24470 [Tepidisphaeraceae bacterium]|nr:hypothetical protein [Tepidisphaeraceae bacterium]